MMKNTVLKAALAILISGATASTSLAASAAKSGRSKKRVARWSTIDFGVSVWREQITYRAQSGDVPVRLLAYGPLLGYAYYLPTQSWTYGFSGAGFVGETNVRGESATTTYQSRARAVGALISVSALRNIDTGVRFGVSLEALARSIKFDSSDPEFSLPDSTRVLPQGSIEMQWNFYQNYTLMQRIGLGVGVDGTFWQMLLTYRL